MRTTFTFEDDKELAQLAFAYVDTGTQISWAGVAQRMRRAGHSARELQQPLMTLMKTWGTDIRRFPPSFFTQVQRPRGRPLEVTRQLHQGATQRQRRAAACPPTPASPAAPASSAPPASPADPTSSAPPAPPALQQTPAPPASPAAPASSAPPAPPGVQQTPAPPASPADPTSSAPPAPPALQQTPAPPASPPAPASSAPPAPPAPRAPSASAHDEDLVTSSGGDSSSLRSPGVPAQERSAGVPVKR